MEMSPDIFRGTVIEGIDFQEGLRNFPPDAYMDVLRAWCKHISANLDKLNASVGMLSLPETLKEYTVVVHGLKGSNYGIYAGDLGKAAEALEGASRRGDIEFIKAKHGPFIEKASLLHSQLKDFIEAHQVDTGEKPMASAPDTALLAQFLTACRQFKSSLMEDILQSLEAFEYESDGDLIPWLREQTDNLEYEAIQERLSSIT